MEKFLKIPLDPIVVAVQETLGNSPSRGRIARNLFRVEGAVGDGKADDWEPIQRALNDAGQAVLKDYKDAKRSGIRNDEHASDRAKAVVALPSGIFRHSGTLTVPENVSLMGSYLGTMLVFESAPGHNSDPNEPTVLTLHDGLNQVVKNRKVQFHLKSSTDVEGFGRLLSVDSFITDLHVQPRDAIAFWSPDVKQNFRIFRVCGQGYSHGGGMNSIFFAVAPSQGDYGWLTDGCVRDCFIEGFNYGLYGPMGEAFMVQHNDFGINEVGIYITNLSKGAIISGNVFHTDPHWPKNNWPWAGKTGVIINGDTVQIANNVFRGVEQGVIAQGRNVSVLNNTMKLYRYKQGCMVRCVSKQWRGGPEFGMPEGWGVGGSDYGSEGLILVSGNQGDVFEGDLRYSSREGLYPIYVEPAVKVQAVLNYGPAGYISNNR